MSRVSTPTASEARGSKGSRASEVRRALAESDLSGAYPSLSQHLASRRRFLGVTGVAGATLATGGLLGGCMRSLGISDDSDASTRSPDARPRGPDGHIEMPGEMPWPDYLILRIPLEHLLSAYLVDGGYCAFFVELATYVEASYLALVEHMGEAMERCRSAVADMTYDSLSTAAGLASAEDDVLDALDALVRDLNGHSDSTIFAVTVTIVILDPYTPIDGGMPEPSYPE